MIDVEERLRAELERMVAVDPVPDWDEVVAASGLARERSRRRRRWAVIAAAVAAAASMALATPLGPAIARGLDEFSTWLSGQPGSPVSEREQREFEAKNRSWLGFPEGIELRRLITREAAGMKVDLLGFRSGASSLCLRLNVSGPLRATTLKCAPLAELRREGGPVRVLIADQHVGKGDKYAWYGIDRYHSAKLLITAGIAADDVSSVVLRDDAGRHEVDVEANAFLYVAEDPEVAQRVKSVWARTTRGLVAVPFAPIPTAFGGGIRPAPAPPAPTLERRISGGGIGWLERREPRGEPLEVLPERVRSHVLGQRSGPSLRAPTNVIFGRVLTPDPDRPLRIVLTLNAHRPGGPVAGLCKWFVTRGGSGGGCTLYPDVFERSPLATGMTAGGSGAFVTIDGYASDDVARVEAIMATRERADVALADNVFAVDLPRAKLPARLIAYDEAGRAIAVSHAWNDIGHSLGPARGRAALLLRVQGPGESYAELSVGPSNQGGECQYVKHFVDRQHTGVGVSCKGANWSGPAVQVYSQFQPVRFVAGRVRDDVETVRIRLADGAAITLRPTRGYVLYATPAQRLSKARAPVAVEGLNDAGRVVGRMSFTPPPMPGG